MTQYYSRVDRKFNGDSKIVTIPFPYIKREDIEVLIDDNVITEWSWLNDSQITINTELISGNILSICRTTRIDEKIVDYKNMGMVLNEDNLNASQNQLLYSIQELYDNNEVFKQDTNEILIDNKQEVIELQEAFEDEVNTKIEMVSSAAEKINQLEEAVNTAVTAADTASQKADETIELVEQANIDIQETLQDFTENIDSKISVNNENMQSVLAETESVLQEARDVLADTLTTSQITNCILEIPQRIKYTLEDGTLTIKAGSVVIVPYGNEDLTAQHPIGTTFLNDNFKVYDTQFEDGKFFVWAEVQNDTVATLPSTASETSRFVLLDLQTGSIRTNNSGEFASSGNVASSGLVYRTDLNKVEHYTTNLTIDYITGFPLMIAIANFETGKFTSINKVFNGMGYIGSTVWVDKGVKGLMPNGRNEDGSLKNVEFETSGVFTHTKSTTSSYNASLTINSNSINAPDFSAYLYDEQNNINKFNGRKANDAIVGLIVASSGAITSFQPKQPFRAIDYSDKSEVSGWSMPSSKPIELSWGAFGTEYTAPCNGFFEAGGRINNNGYIALWNKTINLGGKSCSSLNNFLLNAWIFANKGDVVQLQYVNYVSDGGVRFFPCVGCEREV